MLISWPNKADSPRSRRQVKAATAADQERQAAQAQLAALTEAAHTATARVEEITKCAVDLKTSVEETQGALRSQTADIIREREQHDRLRARLDALTPELATLKARADAQDAAQLDLA